MEFVEFSQIIKNHFEKMSKGKTLFEVDVDKEEFWNLYLDSFPKGANEIYRKRREFDCSCCKNFIKAVGNIVVVKDDYTLETMWDVNVDGTIYEPVVKALSAYIKNRKITDVFLMTENRRKIGAEVTYEYDDEHKVSITWNHYSVVLPSECLLRGDLVDTRKGEYRDSKNVFKRSVEEISQESVKTVLELIDQNSLYRGAENQAVLKRLLMLQQKAEAIPADLKENFYWCASILEGPAVSRIKNHSIGTLLVDITNGVDLNDAVSAYERIVAPSNYKRPKAIYTKAMIERAQRDITELGYLNSLPRRYAHLEDITINNVLFANRDAASKMKNFDVFEEMKSSVAVSAKNFSRVEEIPIEAFVEKVLPTAESVEALFEGDKIPNLVSLIAPKDKEAPSMFKWNNNFSWAYKGNVTDSIKQNVQKAGGKIDGVLRFSIQWNDTGAWDRNDLDAHCKCPGGEIYFSNKYEPKTGGSLDVDIIDPSKGVPAVENITWPTLNRMREGEYDFFVHVFSYRGGESGFRAEIEFDGQIYSYDHSASVGCSKDKIMVATVTLKDGKFSIKHHMQCGVSSRKVWGVDTNQFIPVSAIMYSPNYWDEQKGIGNKHYLFMLNGCKNDETPNGFYNEFLKEDLLKHKRVFEALGSKMKVEDDDNQLSGLGFSSTQKANLVVKVKSNNLERVLKIKF